MTYSKYGHCSEQMPVFSVPCVLTTGQCRQCRFVRHKHYNIDRVSCFPLYVYYLFIVTCFGQILEQVKLKYNQILRSLLESNRYWRISKCVQEGLLLTKNESYEKQQPLGAITIMSLDRTDHLESLSREQNKNKQTYERLMNIKCYYNVMVLA